MGIDWLRRVREAIEDARDPVVGIGEWIVSCILHIVLIVVALVTVVFWVEGEDFAYSVGDILTHRSLIRDNYDRGARFVAARPVNPYDEAVGEVDAHRHRTRPRVLVLCDDRDLAFFVSRGYGTHKPIRIYKATHTGQAPVDPQDRDRSPLRRSRDQLLGKRLPPIPTKTYHGTLTTGAKGAQTWFGLHPFQKAKGVGDLYIALLTGTEPGVGTEFGDDFAARYRRPTRYQNAFLKVLTKELPRHSRIIIVGHSLGGMIAQDVVAEPEVRKWYREIDVITLGSPATISDDLVAASSPDEARVTITRLRKTGDPVPDLGLDRATFQMLTSSSGLASVARGLAEHRTYSTTESSGYWSFQLLPVGRHDVFGREVGDLGQYDCVAVPNGSPMIATKL